MLPTRHPRRGFTLIELIIVVAIAAILITLAAPGLRDFILVQRLKAVNAQLVTDLQFTRSEAVARGQTVWMVFGANAAQSCYTIYTSPSPSQRCDCLLGAGNACTGLLKEVRTVAINTSDGVSVAPAGLGQPPGLGLGHVSGELVPMPLPLAVPPPGDYVIEAKVDASRRLRTLVGVAGRPTVCAPANPAMGAPAC